MFWRRKKADDAQAPQRLVQEYTPDQVADALLNGRPLGSVESSRVESEGEDKAAAEPAAPQVAAPSRPQATPAAARPVQKVPAAVATPIPASASSEEDEFYFEGETAASGSKEVAPAAPAPAVPETLAEEETVRATASPAPVDTVAALMGALKAGAAFPHSAPAVPAPEAAPATQPASTQSASTQPASVRATPELPLPDLKLPQVSVPDSKAVPEVAPPVPALTVPALTVPAEPVTEPKAAEPNLAEPKPTEPVAAQPVQPSALPASNMDWPLGALRGVALEPAAVAEALAPDWAAAGLMLQESGALRLVHSVVLRVPLLLSSGGQELWVFVYPEASAEAAAHFVAVERKANIYGAVAVYLAPSALQLAGVQPATLVSELQVSLSRWPEGKPFPAADYALWWPTQAGEHLERSEDGRLLGRIFTLQDEAASMLYGLLSRQLGWNHELDWNPENEEGLRRALPETTQYLQVMDSEGRPLILSAAQERGVRLHLPRSPESEQLRHYWLEQTEQLLKVLVELLLQSGQPLDTLWHDYETRPSQWWKAAQQVLDLRLEIGDDPSSILVGSVREEQEQTG